MQWVEPSVIRLQTRSFSVAPSSLLFVPLCCSAASLHQHKHTLRLSWSRCVSGVLVLHADLSSRGFGGYSQVYPPANWIPERFVHNIPRLPTSFYTKKAQTHAGPDSVGCINQEHTHTTNTESKSSTGSWDTDSAVKCLCVGAKCPMTLTVWARWSVSVRELHSGKSWVNIQRHWSLPDDHQPQACLFPGCRSQHLLHCHFNAAHFPSPLVKWGKSKWVHSVGTASLHLRSKGNLCVFSLN